jgi:hypothetical protein
MEETLKKRRKTFSAKEYQNDFKIIMSGKFDFRNEYDARLVL